MLDLWVAHSKARCNGWSHQRDGRLTSVARESHCRWQSSEIKGASRIWQRGAFNWITVKGVLDGRCCITKDAIKAWGSQGNKGRLNHKFYNILVKNHTDVNSIKGGRERNDSRGDKGVVGDNVGEWLSEWVSELASYLRVVFVDLNNLVKNLVFLVFRLFGFSA